MHIIEKEIPKDSEFRFCLHIVCFMNVKHNNNQPFEFRLTNILRVQNAAVYSVEVKIRSKFLKWFGELIFQSSGTAHAPQNQTSESDFRISG